jgi:predicted lipoprotein with Yx(FWY)xxD motif
MFTRKTLLTASLALAAAVASILAPAALHAQTLERHGLVRDADGRTLYVHDLDHNGTPSCVADCAALWPPFVAGPDVLPGDQVTVHARADGRMQWGWNGRPLYYYAGDAEPGDANGNGRDGRWHVVAASARPSLLALDRRP